MIAMRMLLFLTIALLLRGVVSAQEADVTFLTPTGMLSGRFMPAATGPSNTTIVLLPGAGNGSFRSGGHQRLMIERFRSVGLNVFAYDKPGVGQSKGTYDEDAPIQAMVNDARAGLTYLRSHFTAQTRRLGVFGQSRSAWVALELAGQGAVDFDINVSPAVMSTMEQEIWARGNSAREQYGLSDEDVSQLNRMRSVVWQYYATGVGLEAAEAAWGEARQSGWFAKMKLSQSMPARDSLDRGFLKYLSNNEYDVRSAAERVSVPTFNILGLNDGFVPASSSAGNLIAALAKAHNTRYKIVLLPNTGHVMEVVTTAVECTQCVLKGEGITPNPAFWQTLAAWIKDALRPYKGVSRVVQIRPRACKAACLRF